jgi:hypothetical protein
VARARTSHLLRQADRCWVILLSIMMLLISSRCIRRASELCCGERHHGGCICLRHACHACIELVLISMADTEENGILEHTC